jgi:hypothetical protein
MSNKKDRTEVNFSPPESTGYKDRIAAAKAGHTPVGGVEMPKMPNLAEPPQQGRHVGVEQRGMKPMPQDQYQQAVAEGRAIPGVGGAYAANQPGRKYSAPPTTPMEMTSKDGNPVNPPRPEGGLRNNTIEQIAAVAEANKAEEKKDDEPISKEDEEYFTRLSAQTDDILRNKERRELIEKRVTDELNFEDLLFHRELRQRVPIRKDFVPTYRTCSGDEDLFVKRLISKDEGSPQYLLDRFSLMTLCCGLFAINGKPLPSHLDEKQNPKEDLFTAKYDVVSKYPLIILADLSANFIWFEQRVQKLLSIESIRDF